VEKEKEEEEEEEEGEEDCDLQLKAMHSVHMRTSGMADDYLHWICGEHQYL
jgi:hypothetical protein